MYGFFTEGKLKISRTQLNGFKPIIRKVKPKGNYPYKRKVMETQDHIIFDWELDESYWNVNKYDELVDREIRQKYTISQELAILRQRYNKPVEYNEYFNYCEECKRKVKSKLGL